MSRINEAWKRTTGAAAEPHPPQILERFPLEKPPRLDESKVSSFVTAGPLHVEGSPSASQSAPLSAWARAHPNLQTELHVDTDPPLPTQPPLYPIDPTHPP